MDRPLGDYDGFAERPRQNEAVPGVESPGAVVPDAHQHDRQAGLRGEIDQAQLDTPARPARPIGYDGDMRTGGSPNHRAHRLHAAARLRAADGAVADVL